MRSNRVALIEANGWKAYLYYALFPLDLMRPENRLQLAYQQRKLNELLPILGWLVPALVLLSTTTTGMGFVGLIFFFALEALLLALLTKFHLKLAWNQTAEMWLNLWAGMVVVMIAFGILSFSLGVLSEADFDD